MAHLTNVLMTMLLNRNNLQAILQKTGKEQALVLPSRVIQFGTGVLLRALPDYCIDQANKQGVFIGGVQLIKSGPYGDILDFERQDCLYSLRVEGMLNGEKHQEDHIISCISGVLDAAKDWDAVLALAADPRVNIVISNTTEAGIVEVADNIFAKPPQSFPGKLTAYLYQRYTSLQNTSNAAIIILPTELIDNNGAALHRIVISLAKKAGLEAGFFDWLAKEAYFCNTLVDRIVPGKLTPEHLGYKDSLMVSAEPYLLWAIESDSDFVKRELSFSTVVPGVFVQASIADFKEIKLRILNASHTLMTGLALLAKHEFVKDSLAQASFESFLQSLIQAEIKPCLHAKGIANRAIDEYAAKLIDRFKNPFLAHQWNAIAQNITLKIRNRVLPLIEGWYQLYNHPPKHIALGFAAYLYFMKGQATMPAEDTIDRDHLLIMQEIWRDAPNPLAAILSEDRLWGTDLSRFTGWLDLIAELMRALETNSIEKILISYRNDEGTKA